MCKIYIAFIDLHFKFNDVYIFYSHLKKSFLKGQLTQPKFSQKRYEMFESPHARMIYQLSVCQALRD